MDEMVFSPVEDVKQPGILVVEDIIRRYPSWRALKLEGQSTIRTVNYRGTRGGKGGRKDPTAAAAIQEFPPDTERKYRAVRKAIVQTHHQKNGLVRLEIIDLVYWKRTHTLTEAANTVSCTEAKAQQYQAEFIEMVKQALGIADCEGCRYYRELLYNVMACYYCWDNIQLRIKDLDGCYSKELERCPYYEEAV